MMLARAIVLSVVIGAAGLYGNRAQIERPVARESLSTFPSAVSAWRAHGDLPLDDEVLGVLGVDDYVNRVYERPGAPPVSLYIGYYNSQRQGDAIHSPQNCLPGAGWQPVESGRTSLQIDGRSLPLNRYVIQKGIDTQVVLYWYQGRGRVIANEYANKFWLMVDAARLHRSNGGLVRVIAPVRAASGGLSGADAATADFTRALFRRLSAYLP
jgi:EpsI family protein